MGDDERLTLNCCKLEIVKLDDSENPMKMVNRYKFRNVNVCFVGTNLNT